LAKKTKQTGGMSDGSPTDGASKTFIPTELGSARFATLRGQDDKYKYEAGPTDLTQGTKGPPWSVEPSMRFVCDEAGIDYHRFIAGLRDDKSDMEMAREFNVPEKTIQNLRERFYTMDVPITGNYGQD